MSNKISNGNLNNNNNNNKTENKKIIRSIYQDIYSDNNKPKEEKKYENIMQLIEEDYKNSDQSYYAQFKSHKVYNEINNIMNIHKKEMARIKSGQRINGIDLNSLKNKNRKFYNYGKREVYKYDIGKNSRTKINSFLISKLIAKIFLVIFKVKQLHIKIKEKLLQKKISNKNKEIAPLFFRGNIKD